MKLQQYFWLVLAGVIAASYLPAEGCWVNVATTPSSVSPGGNAVTPAVAPASPADLPAPNSTPASPGVATPAIGDGGTGGTPPMITATPATGGGAVGVTPATAITAATGGGAPGMTPASSLPDTPPPLGVTTPAALPDTTIATG